MQEKPQERGRGVVVETQFTKKQFLGHYLILIKQKFKLSFILLCLPYLFHLRFLSFGKIKQKLVFETKTKDQHQRKHRGRTNLGLHTKMQSMGGGGSSRPPFTAASQHCPLFKWRYFFLCSHRKLYTTTFADLFFHRFMGNF